MILLSIEVNINAELNSLLQLFQNYIKVHGVEKQFR